MAKISPILFSTVMVVAILEGIKTQTRRAIKEKSGTCMFCGYTDEDCSVCIERQEHPCSWSTDTRDKFVRDMERAGGTFLIKPGFNHLAVSEQSYPETRRERRERLRKNKSQKAESQ